VIRVAIDWASRYLALPASSPGLAIDPPEEGGFLIGARLPWRAVSREIFG
jgi:hypothetical protein